ncbi:hypothetical protein [Bdellovibrio sp. HCB337]|uniref:hypothetical protein n=1 Tax=Bdellovibrio sp. HCB337 TaxID=3394358 RepID=UPI0039A6ABA6
MLHFAVGFIDRLCTYADPVFSAPTVCASETAWGRLLFVYHQAQVVGLLTCHIYSQIEHYVLAST